MLDDHLIVCLLKWAGVRKLIASYHPSYQVFHGRFFKTTTFLHIFSSLESKSILLNSHFFITDLLPYEAAFASKASG